MPQLKSLLVLVQLLALPATLMMVIGLYNWHQAIQLAAERRRKQGKLFFIFGATLLAISLVISLYIHTIIRHYHRP